MPAWGEWIAAYAKHLNYTVRTLQTRIKGLREGKKRGTSDSRPTIHYTKKQTDEMFSTCKFAIEAKKASEDSRPVDVILALAKIKMGAKLLLDINETAQQLPDYRKCTERLLSVIEKYTKREAPAEEIVKVASEIRKEVTPKQANASLSEAARAGKKGMTSVPVVVDAEPEQAKRAAPAKTPTPAGGNKAVVTSGSAMHVAAKASPAAKGGAAPKAQPLKAAWGEVLLKNCPTP